MRFTPSHQEVFSDIDIVVHWFRSNSSDRDDRMPEWYEQADPMPVWR